MECILATFYISTNPYHQKRAFEGLWQLLSAGISAESDVILPNKESLSLLYVAHATGAGYIFSGVAWRGVAQLSFNLPT